MTVVNNCAQSHLQSPPYYKGYFNTTSVAILALGFQQGQGIRLLRTINASIKVAKRYSMHIYMMKYARKEKKSC